MLLFVFIFCSFALPQSENVDVFKPIKNEAFVKGEVLTYRLHYGIIDAGTAVLEVKNEARNFGGRSTLHVVGIGRSRGAFDWFFKVRDRYESYIDEEALLPVNFIRHVDEGGYKIDQNHSYNRYKKQVVSDGKVFDIPVDTQDMLSAFYYARCIDFSNATIGAIYTINSFVDNQVFPLKIKYMGKETIKTDFGKVNCIKFRPVIQKGRIFKNEEDLNVWITDDKNRIPIRVQANILIGSVKMDLQEYKGLAHPTKFAK